MAGTSRQGCGRRLNSERKPQSPHDNVIFAAPEMASAYFHHLPDGTGGSPRIVSLFTRMAYGYREVRDNLPRRGRVHSWLRSRPCHRAEQHGDNQSAGGLRIWVRAPRRRALSTSVSRLLAGSPHSPRLAMMAGCPVIAERPRQSPDMPAADGRQRRPGKIRATRTRRLPYA